MFGIAAETHRGLPQRAACDDSRDGRVWMSLDVEGPGPGECLVMLARRPI